MKMDTKKKNILTACVLVIVAHVYLCFCRDAGNVTVNESVAQKNKRLAIKLLLLVVAMMGFCMALIPLI